MHYPSDYGFIPETLAQDADPLDALVLVREPTFPGCHIEAKPVGLFKMWDEKGPDEKIICVPVLDPLWNHIESLDDVPPHLLKEIEHFFRVYKDLEEKKVGIEGWDGRDAAIRIIEESRQRFRDQLSLIPRPASFTLTPSEIASIIVAETMLTISMPEERSQ